MSGNDPFNLVYDKLWTLVERNQELQNYIKIGNRIKFDENVVNKSEISDADLPELALLVSGLTDFGSTSSSYIVKKNYTFSLAVGDYRIAIFNRISFELFRALADYQCELCSLSWCNCNFVDNAKLLNAEESILEDTQRAISGWIGIWTFEVTMVFNQSILKIKLPPIG